MRKYARQALSVVFLLLFSIVSAQAAPRPRPVAPPPPVLVQFGAIDALLAGSYAGTFTLGQLRRAGDIGLGTFDGLNGEMVLLNHVVYQVTADGRVHRPSDSATMPFGQAVRFHAVMTVPLPAGADLAAIAKDLDRALGHTDRFAVVRVEGDFSGVTTRSCPLQTPPYRPLAEVAKTQSVFHLGDVRGTLIGLRSPDFARGLSVPGWHWHFLTSDHAKGGHVLALSLASKAGAGLMPVQRYLVNLPAQGFGGLDLSRDRGKELRSVEGGSGPAK